MVDKKAAPAAVGDWRVMLVVVDSADAMSPCAFHCLRAVSIMMTSDTDKLDAVQSSLRSHTVYQGVSLSGQTNSSV